MSVFGAYARYYDLLYRDKDYAAEARYVHELIQRHAPGAQSILELGCGTGAHAAEFAGLGYTVHGIDSSEAMLQGAFARRSRLAPEVAERLGFSLGDVRSFRAEQRFDAVTALFHVMSYQTSNEDLAQAISTAATHLAPGGTFVFDFWYGPAVLSDPPVVRVKRLEDSATRVLRIAEPTLRVNENVAEVAYQVLVTDRASGQMEEIRERHAMRYLFAPELTLCLRNVGLEAVHFGEWMSDAEPSDKTWSAVLVGRTAGASGS
ncbi:MAG: class I SAM-dependent methyltransferase [Lysobacterales bacterium]|nr:MAG: class I SAM-dependent methyltransferase [Xanthomonadales bacterium]